MDDRNVTKKEAVIFAMAVSNKLLGLSGVEYEFKPASFFPTPDTAATSNFQIYTFFINKDWHKKEPPMEVMFTIFHEMRHMYQAVQIKFRNKKDCLLHKEDKSRVDKWKQEVQNYVKPSMAGEENDQAYYSQDIEVDAVAFTELLARVLFKSNIHIPDLIKVRVEERIKEIDDVIRLTELINK